MPVRKAEARWEGSLREGRGTLILGSGAFEGPFSYVSRFEEGRGTNPEELIGAAHAGCFSMALSAGLTRSGFAPSRIHTTAEVLLEKLEAGFAITHVQLRTEAEVPGIDETTFKELAETAKANCPVSRALAGVDIDLETRLIL